MPQKVMDITWDAKGTFIERPNRFLGIVDITSPKSHKKKKVKVHVHDPGRLKELLYPKNKVLLRKATNPNRKTKWDLIAAKYEKEWILTHSGFHREIAQWVIENPKVSPFGKVKKIEAEVGFKNSRLDFLLTKKNGRRTWVEVKGCTLAIDGVALFPDAPTLRGARHLEHLIDIVKKGDEASIIILVFRHDSRCFAPKEDTDENFARIFRKAVKVGISAYPLLFNYDGSSLRYLGNIPLCKK
jgi:sugar fermentation stimulation protein A